MSELGLPNVDGGFHHHLKHDVNKPLEDHNQLPTGPVDKYHMNNAMSLDETCPEVMHQGMGERKQTPLTIQDLDSSPSEKLLRTQGFPTSDEETYLARSDSKV